MCFAKLGGNAHHDHDHDHDLTVATGKWELGDGGARKGKEKGLREFQGTVLCRLYVKYLGILPPDPVIGLRLVLLSGVFRWAGGTPWLGCYI